MRTPNPEPKVGDPKRYAPRRDDRSMFALRERYRGPDGAFAKLDDTKKSYAKFQISWIEAPTINLKQRIRIGIAGKNNHKSGYHSLPTIYNARTTLQ